MLYTTLGKTGYTVSRLGFGTAEIGFAYGLGQRNVPDEAEAIKLLQEAVEQGVTFFDTASLYQLAEERIGKSGIANKPGVIVATKCGQFLDRGEQLSAAEMEQKIRQEVEDSLRKLQVDSLPLLQLHGGTAELIADGAVIAIIQKLRSEGKARFLGISTRGEEASQAAIVSGVFDAIQVAYSILDQRTEAQVLPAAKEKNIGVINRSVLLKGVLSGAALNYPEVLAGLRSNAQQAVQIAVEAGMPIADLAIRFALSNDSIATSLIGTASLQHLQDVIKAVEQGPLPTDILDKLRDLAIIDPRLVDPSRWPKF